MFETAVRAAAGEGVDEHLVAGERAVVALQRGRRRRTRTPGSATRRRRRRSARRPPSNRMVGFPYTKYMNSNNDVDMGAALIMCSVEKARGARRPARIGGCSCTRARTATSTSSSAIAGRSPRRRRSSSAAAWRSSWPGSASTTSAIVDLYSCFPSAVQLGAKSLGLDLDRQLTRTGGLVVRRRPVEQLRDARDRDRDERPARAAGREGARVGERRLHDEARVRRVLDRPAGRRASATRYPQDEIDAMPRRELAEAAGRSRGRRRSRRTPSCTPATARRSGRSPLPPRRRTAGVGDVGRRPDLAAAMCDGEWVGRAVTLDADGTLHSS